MSSLENNNGSIITLCFMFLYFFFSNMWFDISAAMRTRVNPPALSVPREERQQHQMVHASDSGSTRSLQIVGLKQNSTVLLYLRKKPTAHQVDSSQELCKTVSQSVCHANIFLLAVKRCKSVSVLSLKDGVYSV